MTAASHPSPDSPPTPSPPSPPVIAILADEPTDDLRRKDGGSAQDAHGGDRDDDVARGLAGVDPLVVRPRRSALVVCVVLAVMLIAAAGGVWWMAVRTAEGQAFEDMVWQYLPSTVFDPLRVAALPFARSLTVIALTVAMGSVAVIVAIVRRRWRLVGQAVALAALCYAATWLKPVLPRPMLIHTVSRQANSAPSGHTMMAAAAAMVLLIAVPRAWRAVTAVVAVAVSCAVGLSVMVQQWHRPVDVVMSILLAAAMALIVLAFTRRSGMDAPGDRASSPSIQIVGSVLVTAGFMAVVYGAYVVWQIFPGLGISAQWTRSDAVAASQILVCGSASLACGIVLVMRQIVACPLTRLGVIGAPPAPPSR